MPPPPWDRPSNLLRRCRTRELQLGGRLARLQMHFRVIRRYPAIQREGAPWSTWNYWRMGMTLLHRLTSTSGTKPPCQAVRRKSAVEGRTDSCLTFKADHDTKADMGVVRTLTRVASGAILPRHGRVLSSDMEAPTHLDRSNHTLCDPGRTRKALKPADKANGSRRGSVLKSPSS